MPYFENQDGKKSAEQDPKKIFEDAVRNMYKRGHSGMKEASKKEHRVFHTVEHPEALIERAKKLSHIFELSKIQKKMVALEAIYHDLVINYDPAQNPEDVTGRIKRHRGAREGDQPANLQGNEALSAKALVAEMSRHNTIAQQKKQSPVFSQEQISNATFAIDVTYPGVQLGPDFQGVSFREYPYYKEIVTQHKDIGRIISSLEKDGILKGILFYQPHLETPLEKGEQVPKEAIIIALSDLGAAGLDTSKTFFREGDTELLELMENIRRPKVKKRLLEGTTEMDKNDRAKVAGIMQQWLKDQTSFVAWQMLRFEKIVFLLKKNGQIDSEKESALRNLFSNFEKNITATLKRTHTLSKTYHEILVENGELKAFQYLAKEMHYEKSRGGRTF